MIEVVRARTVDGAADQLRMSELAISASDHPMEELADADSSSNDAFDEVSDDDRRNFAPNSSPSGVPQPPSLKSTIDKKRCLLGRIVIGTILGSPFSNGGA